MLHLVILAASAYLLRTTPRGSADEPERTAGIVLKRIGEEGKLYEGEEEVVEQTTPLTNVAREALLSALPDDSSAPDLSNSLPSLPVIGRGSPADGGFQQAGEMTSGGETGRPLASYEVFARAPALFFCFQP